MDTVHPREAGNILLPLVIAFLTYTGHPRRSGEHAAFAGLSHQPTRIIPAEAGNMTFLYPHIPAMSTYFNQYFKPHPPGKDRASGFGYRCGRHLSGRCASARADALSCMPGNTRLWGRPLVVDELSPSFDYIIYPMDI